MRKKRLLVYSILVLIVVSLVVVGYRNAKAPGKYDDFAKCLTSKDVLMYGAYWCPHCTDQKKLFGKSFQYVTYVECALPGNPNQQTALCIQRNIESYPTWEVNGSKVLGVLPLEDLSARTGCQLL